MLKPRTNFLRILYALADVVIIIFSYYFAEWLWLVAIKQSNNIILDESLKGYVLAAVILYAAIILMFSLFSGIYKTFRYKSIWKIWIKSTFINAIMVGIIIVLLYIFRIQDISRGMLFIFLATVSVLTFIKHMAAVGLLRLIRFSGYNQKHVILIGNGSLAENYSATVSKNKRYGITVDGYLACNGSDEENNAIGKYLGQYDELEKYIKSHGVDEVIIALEEPTSAVIFSVIECCEKCGTRVCVIPFYNYMISSVPSLHTVGNLKCFELRTSPLDDKLNEFFKRVFDIVFSLFIIIITSPVLLLVALGVKLSSPGPVLFKQQRVGKEKKLFTMYKFRSMKVNVDSDTAWSKDKDPRRTRFGSFIRKTSLDELPQFFNVLKGDMSVIGPRPEIPHYVEQFRETIPKYMLKHLVRPGITGWAQINGYRGDTSIEERIKCDIWYIENWTAGLDIKILFRTVFGGMVNNEKTK